MNDAIAQAVRLAGKPASAAAARVQHGVPFMGGLLKSSGHGRTDTLPINVPAGCYVLPADVVSGLGQGNTLAGAKALDRILADLRAVPVAHPSLVPIVAAGGEYVIAPWFVSKLGGGSLKKGHDMLDGYVRDVRAKTHKTLRNLPGPAK